MIDSNTITIHEIVENFVRESGTDYIDAIITYCEQNDIEIETVASIIAKDLNLVSKIQTEAEDLHYIKRTNTLPI